MRLYAGKAEAETGQDILGQEGRKAEGCAGRRTTEDVPTPVVLEGRKGRWKEKGGAWLGSNERWGVVLVLQKEKEGAGLPPPKACVYA